MYIQVYIATREIYMKHWRTNKYKITKTLPITNLTKHILLIKSKMKISKSLKFASKKL